MLCLFHFFGVFFAHRNKCISTDKKENHDAW